ncbi:MAG: ABC transporter ATP-binding protein [Candidatus Rokubacteria bacterium]|nr:ABC transporter ATP-binding protein [Candidatus Rokubacteria bacterium]
MLLELKGVEGGYHKKTVLRGIALRVEAGEVVALIGHNGAGKTSTLKAIFGLIRVSRGQIFYDGREISNRDPALNTLGGISFVPQGRGIFADLTVAENLRLGAYSLPRSSPGLIEERLRAVVELFPILMERMKQRAGLLSGGQQQMLALGMALMQRPRLLLLDEPSLGLAPLLVQRVIESVQEINRRFGTAILLVEQNIRQALRISARVYVMKVGQIALEERSATLLEGGEFWHLF